MPSIPPMRRVHDAAEQLGWLGDRPAEESVTGYAAAGWPAETWLLHAMYENPSLRELGTHDDQHRRRLGKGAIAPLVIGGVNVDEVSTVTGTPLGFVVHPGQPWQRLRWSEYLSRTPERQPDRSVPPSFRWFRPGSFPVAVQPPPEGSLDEDSLAALLQVLRDQSVGGGAAGCYAYYASLPANDFDSVHLWHGPLSGVPALLEAGGGPYASSPTNLWPEDRSWFVWTDWDLQSTRVSGSARLVEALKATPALETLDWSAP